MDSLARDKAEFLQAGCGYASALCHYTLFLISSVKLLQMNLLLVLLLGWISRRLSQSGKERCSEQGFRQPGCPVKATTTALRLKYCGVCSLPLASSLKSSTTNTQDATSLFKTSTSAEEAKAATAKWSQLQLGGWARPRCLVDIVALFPQLAACVE